ncbi:MAG: OB-fold nucleic acid binding domain-containing protein [Actinobacteria bacterium]|nr:OB-fold nucleic acid binding domain-containing protein [Actinomycetota bacterium]
MAKTLAGSPLRKMWQRLGTSDADIEAGELQESARGAGATAIDHCACGEIVTVCGPLRSVTLLPVAGLPSVEAELYDGSGAISLVWMGRRRIQGIEPGRVLTATGRLGMAQGRRVIYNPRYALRPISVGE